ncbi:FMN-dependent NADH-azoreductase [Pedobacter africanus]|uniref:FMN-dependent NADH-azoreductase n=1 Tax=Pedobacter africanus TaxID=151894 RepID=A0ACC6KS13_9SPHI|nr:NAD(P)H-dependent oxidoreductase [Pedobacter africanus]MDR6782001.1 FMN-dependent NADH-azoreductase [Pedobacter africanus]
MRALHIISSPRGKQSYSRGLSSAIVERLLERNIVKTVVERNLIENVTPHLDEVLVKEFYKIPEKTDSNPILSYADSIFCEIKEADVIVIGTPMHNLGVSAPLKAWIDQLVRFGITYGYGNDGKRYGYLKGKKVYLAIASGGRSADWPENFEFIASYIKAVFNAYLGITDIYTFRIEGTASNNFEANYEEIIKSLK